MLEQLADALVCSFRFTPGCMPLSASLTPICPKNSLASSASSSPLSAVIFPTHPYRQITSSRRNLQTALVVLFHNARPSTWFVKSSLARTMYRICHNPTSIVTRSTTHLKCITKGYVGFNPSRCQSTSLYIPFHQYCSLILLKVAQTPLCSAHKLS